MTYTYTFDNCVILQQTGSAFINSETATQLRRLQEAGYQVDAVHNFSEGERCYVILSMPIQSEESVLAEIEAQWNSVKSYITEMTEIHDTRS